MLRNFNFSGLTWASLRDARRGPRFWLLVACASLIVANLIALFFYIAPPGGSQADLEQQRDALRGEMTTARLHAARLRGVSGKVELGSEQAVTFEGQYFLPDRLAYETIISEIQRMAKASGLEEREAVYSREPIEGSDDYSVLNTGARFQGSYDNFIRFLHEADVSPMLLMLDTVQATPQQHSGQIEAEIRFQAIVTDSSLPAALAVTTSQAAGAKP